MGVVAGFVVLILCLGWTVWWGVRLARRGQWVPAALLWVAAAALVVEVGFNRRVAARRVPADLTSAVPGL